MADVMSPSYSVCRIMTDVVCVFIGFTTGGPLGIATIILMFGTGPLISTWNKLLKNLPKIFLGNCRVIEDFFV